MKATIYFFYEGGGYESFSGTAESHEKDIRYWLDKRRGYNLHDIIMLPENLEQSFLWLKDKMLQEEAAYATVIAERSEREEFERLKAKFEGGSYTPRKTSYIVRHTLNGLSEWKPGMKFMTFDHLRTVYVTEAATEDELRTNLACDHCSFVRISQDPVFPKEQCAWFEEEGLID